MALGPTASEAAAKQLDAKFKVPFELLELPIGLRATDRFVNTLRRQIRAQVPPSINDQRGRLMDMITDMHQYFYGVRVALWGDPDQLVSLAEFLADLDMRPVYIVTGTPGKQFEKRIEAALAGRVPEAKFRQGPGADMFLMHQWIKNEPVDLLIGNTYGKYIAQGREHPAGPAWLPDSRPRRPFVLPHGWLSRGDAAAGNDPRRPAWTTRIAQSPEESFELVM